VAVISAPDDRTVAYILESQPLFDDLRQVAAQLAGLLVLAATGSRDARPDHPMLVAAAHLLRETRERVEQTRATERARPHRDSLLQAANALNEAVPAARALLAATSRADFDRVLIPLRDGYSHLQQAARELPGFRMVAFEQGCCAGGRTFESEGTAAS
jgi:beta-phosphoglucomutase-like phosphatase (HAD superfamily)